MIRIAICDDEKNGQEGLCSLIKEAGVLEEGEFFFFQTGSGLIDCVNKGEKYDFVFLDVDMPEIDGIETGKYINGADPKSIIIFYSAYPQFAVDAFDCNAFHYIVKGTAADKFKTILKRAYQKHLRLNSCFTFKVKEGIVSVPISEINYIEYFKKHIIIHTEKTDYMIRDSMASACEKLCGLGFYLCHQSFLVNFEKVHCIMKTDIVLVNGEKVMLSVRKRSETVAAYNRYLERFVL